MGRGRSANLDRVTSPIVKTRPSALQYALLAGQLALLTLIIRQFQIESNAFIRVALLAFVGFAVHALLPLRYRLPFFLLLSLSAIAMVFGAEQTAWLVGLGLVLIGLCHLPVPFAVRLLLLVGAGVLLAFQRVEWLPAPWSAAVWPILGSMFMFRLMVYVYDLRHEKEPPTLWRTLSYFFLLPNVCFPMFPVVDYKTFRRNYYDEDAYRIYQVGVDWMTRGLVQLIAYRYVYYHVTLSPSEVVGPGSLLQFMVANFLLYLRISGQFHLVVGMLHLFGFRLPETHKRWLLAASFTDFWRRINIYWKDFMQKLFYYPAYFWLRRWGQTRALIVSTIFTFFMTWLLHAYQWFWLRGSVLLSAPDMAFWGLLAILVVANSLYEIRHGRERSIGRAPRSFRRFAGTALRTAGTFAAICLLWSLWTADSLAAWLSTLRPAVDPAIGAQLGPVILVAAVLGSASGRVAEPAARGGAVRRLFRASAAPTVASLLLLAAGGIHDVYSRVLSPDLASTVNSLRSGKLSRHDAALRDRGYYEDLIRVDRFNGQLWEVYMNPPRNRWLDIEAAGIDRFTGDFAQKALAPSMRLATRMGPISTNRWGMRDRNYERQPAPGTFRIAVLGSSSVMGWGVGDGETFEHLIEDRLNRERAGAPWKGYELLNFAVPGYQPPQQLVTFDQALDFGPHAVFYIATGREARRSADYLWEAVNKKLEIPYPELKEIAARARVTASMDRLTGIRALAPHQFEILSHVYGRIAKASLARGIVPVLVFLPQVPDGEWRDENPEILRRAAEAGFLVIDLDDVYKGQDLAAIQVAPGDSHPNARGHRIVADRLSRELEPQLDRIFAARSAAAPTPPSPR
jgi:D-alanyl-lipoteichoic acid acyltransferase DltB (MBOAT superfamily)